MNNRKWFLLLSICFVSIVTVLFFTLWSRIVATPAEWPSEVIRKVDWLQVKVIDRVSGKMLFTYDPEVGYSVKTIKKDGDDYIVIFSRLKN